MNIEELLNDSTVRASIYILLAAAINSLLASIIKVTRVIIDKRTEEETIEDKITKKRAKIGKLNMQISDLQQRQSNEMKKWVI